jgi:hypothetical protein
VICLLFISTVAALIAALVQRMTARWLRDELIRAEKTRDKWMALHDEMRGMYRDEKSKHFDTQLKLKDRCREIAAIQEIINESEADRG